MSKLNTKEITMTAKELRKLRLSLDLTQAEMAKKLLMSKTMYSLNETGKNPISQRTAALCSMMPECGD